MVIKYIVTQALKAGVKKASKKSWKDRRIGAMNREIKKFHGKPAITEKYIDEYGKIIESKAKTKKEYKGGK